MDLVASLSLFTEKKKFVCLLEQALWTSACCETYFYKALFQKVKHYAEGSKINLNVWEQKNDDISHTHMYI